VWFVPVFPLGVALFSPQTRPHPPLPPLLPRLPLFEAVSASPPLLLELALARLRVLPRAPPPSPSFAAKRCRPSSPRVAASLETASQKRAGPSFMWPPLPVGTKAFFFLSPPQEHRSCPPPCHDPTSTRMRFPRRFSPFLLSTRRTRCRRNPSHDAPYPVGNRSLDGGESLPPPRFTGRLFCRFTPAPPRVQHFIIRFFPSAYAGIF